HFYQLFPNAIDANNRITAGVDLSLPRPGWTMVAGGPAGTNRLLAIVAPSPRDFGDAGLRKASPFSEFDLREAARVYARDGPRALAGKAVGCRESADACASFGAAMLELREVN
ncbi:MAG: DUF4384 domain-containing protein, partial [Burkholderiaceae bacterium]|nr:DUF4384 domain-containing protein [Burkholderiaceae bacterium]